MPRWPKPENRQKNSPVNSPVNARRTAPPGARSARVPSVRRGRGRCLAALGVRRERQRARGQRHHGRGQRGLRRRRGHVRGGRGRLRPAERRRLGGAGPRPVRAADPAGGVRLHHGQGTLRPALRLASPGRDRLLPQSARRGHQPGLRPQVRPPGGRPVRRAQLRGLVVDQRPDRGRDQDGRGERQRREPEDRDRGRGHPADRLLQRARGPRPRRTRRLLPDGGHLGPDAGRRHRRGRPGLRADQ